MTFVPRGIRVHREVERIYRSIEQGAALARQPHQAVWKGIATALVRLRADALWGDRVPHVPRYFAEKYGVRNLFCVDLAAFHRMFNTIEENHVVLPDLVDHRTYDKWFGRKRR